MLTRRDFLKVTAIGGAFASIGSMNEAKAAVKPVLPDEAFAYESGRKIPLIAETDLVVVGGSARAVAAAVAAAKSGCRVFLVCDLPYLGEEICASHLYEREKGEELRTALSRRIFQSASIPTPMTVKKVLEDALIDNGVKFLYSSYATNVLVDQAGEAAGVVIANRSGREAIRCRAIIDATHEATVAGFLDAERTPFKPGEQDFDFTVVGNAPKQAKEIIGTHPWKKELQVGSARYPVTRYTFRFPMRDNSYAALQEVEQRIRTSLWDADQVDSSDRLWYIPRQNIICKAHCEALDGSLRSLPLDAFAPKSAARIWILGPEAGLSRELAARVMRPVPAMWLGELIGEQVADVVGKLSLSRDAVVKKVVAQASAYGTVGEHLQPLRPLLGRGWVESPASALPVLGQYDVVVMGGGVAGASAGISAARQGAKTLVLEYLHGLGGLGTLGMIGVYWDGFRGGYTATLDKGVLAMAPSDHPRRPKEEGRFPADWKMEWLRKELLDVGGELWFGAMGCGALSEGGQVKGLVVATPQGRGVVLSKIVIDSTGSADIAIAAGAGYEYTGKNTIAVQGAGTGKWAPGDYYNNNDWLFVDDTDVLDVSRAFVQAKNKSAGQFDLVKIPQTRERRRMVGDYTVSVYDVLSHRRYADTISYHKSSFDTHGMTIDPYFTLNPPEKRHKIYDADVPLRALLPKGLENILATGLGASAHRDAMPVIRMQPCLQNQGYAVGYLAALCVKEGKTPRQIDIKKIQRHLVKIGNLPERVLTDKAFKGYSNGELKRAAQTVTNRYEGLEVLLADTKRSLPWVRSQLAKTGDSAARLVLASILCMYGEKEAAPVVAEAVREKKEWDEGWHYTGMGQFGMCLSQLDALIMALGNAKDPVSLAVVLEKAKLLCPEDYFSHYRAIAEAAEAIGSEEAVRVLSMLLTAPGVRYHSLNDYVEARRETVPDMEDTSTRNIALKELHLARALYLCGDKDGIGRAVLERYAKGLQGHYARYAYEVLQSKKQD